MLILDHTFAHNISDVNNYVLIIKLCTIVFKETIANMCQQNSASNFIIYKVCRCCTDVHAWITRMFEHALLCRTAV